MSMTREEALELIDRMPFIPTISAHQHRKFRMEEYKKNTDASATPLDLARVVKSRYVHMHFNDRTCLSEEEEVCARDAKRRLEAELAHALGLQEEEVEPYIIKYIAENMDI
jgi:RNA polymerase-interacting CarD/CdnL/TRCF family regulator